MDMSNKMKTFNGMEVYDEAVRNQVNGIKTAGTGAAYTVTVKAIDSLANGVGFIMIPHTVSTIAVPTLNVNNLGAKPIRTRLSSSPQTTISLQDEGFIAANRALKIVYDSNITYTGGSGAWIIDDMTQPNANGLYGTVPIASGGTGADNAKEALNNLGITWGTDTAPTTGTPNSIYIQIN